LELELHNEEMGLLEELGTVLQLLQDQNLIEVGGRVLREDYDRAKAVNKLKLRVRPRAETPSNY
jgi:hypothetical protein